MVSPGNADNYSRAPHHDREIEHRSLDDICRGWRHRQLRLVTAPIHRRLSPLHRFGRACAQRHRPVPAHATQSRNLAILAHGQHSICRGIRVSGLLLTAVLYMAYWANAWYGWWRWRREHSQAILVPSS
jgi:hypothetical protein